MQLIGSYRTKNRENLSNFTASFKEGAKYADMWEAAYAADVHWVRLELAKPDVDFMRQNKHGRNILHEAARGGFHTLIRFICSPNPLVEKLDVPTLLRQRDVFGFTPRALAKRRRYEDCIQQIDKVKARAILISMQCVC